jgi:hypothetical protein
MTRRDEHLQPLTLGGGRWSAGRRSVGAMGFATPSMHDARASRDGLAIRLDGTRTNLSQRFVIWGLANAWRLPALHSRDGKTGQGRPHLR